MPESDALSDPIERFIHFSTKNSGSLNDPPKRGDFFLLLVEIFFFLFFFLTFMRIKWLTLEVFEGR